jgi:hypothetical protein
VQEPQDPSNIVYFLCTTMKQRGQKGTCGWTVSLSELHVILAKLIQWNFNKITVSLWFCQTHRVTRHTLCLTCISLCSSYPVGCGGQGEVLESERDISSCASLELRGLRTITDIDITWNRSFFTWQWLYLVLIWMVCQLNFAW